MRLVPQAVPSLGMPAPAGAAAAPDGDAHPSEDAAKPNSLLPSAGSSMYIKRKTDTQSHYRGRGCDRTEFAPVWMGW